MVDNIKHRMDLKTLQLAFATTTPVLFGYVSVGIAFGLLLKDAGYSWVIALLMSVFVYAGAAQFLAVSFFTSNATLLEVATIIFLVNFRHMLYGLSLFEKFNITGKLKPYMIFSLTDETYALLTSTKDPAGVNRAKYYFYITAFNQIYWVIGTLIGAAAGSFITINTQGLDFALTALFLVLLLEQWKGHNTKLPFLIGSGCAVLSILLIGTKNMLLAAVISSMLILLLVRKRIIANESN